MTLPSLRQTVYLDLYHLIRPRVICAAQRRGVSTLQAVKRGLQSTREASGKRSPYGGGGGGDRSGKDAFGASAQPSNSSLVKIRRHISDDPRTVTTGRHAFPAPVSGSNFIRRVNGLPEQRQSSPVEIHADTESSPVEIERYFGVVRRLADLTKAIQFAESASGASHADGFVNEAVARVKDLNDALRGREWGMRGSLKREVVFYLRRWMEPKGLFLGERVRAENQGHEVAEKTVVVERFGHEIALARKGQNLRRAFSTPAETRRSAAQTSLTREEDGESMAGEQSRALQQNVEGIRHLVDQIRIASQPPGNSHSRKEAVLNLRIHKCLIDMDAFMLPLKAWRERLEDRFKAAFQPDYFVRSRGDSERDGRVITFIAREKAEMFQIAFDRHGMVNVEASASAGSSQSPAESIPKYKFGRDQTDGVENSATAARATATAGVAQEKNKELGQKPSPRSVVSASSFAAPAGGAANDPSVFADGYTTANVVSTDGLDVADVDDSLPISVPYTTAASEFLYGSNVVLAALMAKRRKLYHLYLHPRLTARERNQSAIASLAEAAGIPITRNAPLGLLDKISERRPHNGVVLEASRLPALPVLALQKPNSRKSTVPLSLARQSAEDIAVNGAPEAFSSSTQTWRHPFVVMLDGILDPANLGNILRSAHFYGVDAVAVATGTCAGLSSAVLAKASSGACEAVRLLSVSKPSAFVGDSARAGWRVYAAVAPPVPGLSPAADVRRQTTTTAVAGSSPLANGPVMLLLGAEGEGLRANLVRQADQMISIESGHRNKDALDVGVDSLNVGVAAGVLMEAFLRRPTGAKGMQQSSKSGGGALDNKAGDLGF